MTRCASLVSRCQITDFNLVEVDRSRVARTTTLERGAGSPRYAIPSSSTAVTVVTCCAPSRSSIAISGLPISRA